MKLNQVVTILQAVSFKRLSLGAMTLSVLGSSVALVVPANAFESNLSHATNMTTLLAEAPSSTLSLAPTLQPGINRVTFESEGETLVGNLYLPATYQPGDKLPAVVISGSWTSVKEQMSGTYAQKLSEQGFAALAFDARYWGESGGNIPHYESAEAKIADIQNAVEYLKTLPAIDADRISGLGICAGAGYMAHAVAQDPDIKAFATVAAWLHDAPIVNSVYGAENVQQKLQAAREARALFEATGQVEYVPAYDREDQNAAMWGEVDYYANPQRGVIPEWANRFAVVSWADWLEFDAMVAASDIEVPSVFVHSDNSALPDSVRTFAANVAGESQLVWLEGNHDQFYDSESHVDQAVQSVADFFHQFQ
jgi:uncharacterized protein